MKKSIVLPIIAAFGAVVIAMGVSLGLLYYRNNEKKREVAYKAVVQSAMGQAKEEMFMLIESYEEFCDVFEIDNYDGEYDKKFFKSKSLIAFVANEGESMPTYEVKNVYVEDNTLNVELLRERKGGSYCANWMWVINIEVRKIDIRNIDAIKNIIIEN